MIVRNASTPLTGRPNDEPYKHNDPDSDLLSQKRLGVRDGGVAIVCDSSQLVPPLSVTDGVRRDNVLIAECCLTAVNAAAWCCCGAWNPLCYVSVKGRCDAAAERRVVCLARSLAKQLYHTITGRLVVETLKEQMERSTAQRC